MVTTSSGMWCFLLFTVILPIVPTLTEVVGSVSECNEFFLEEKPPEIPDILQDGNILRPDRYKPICQTYNDTRRFFTLYDTENRIPVFSAYKYKGKNNTKRLQIPWMIEPQLEDRNSNMVNEKFLKQAYNPDYTNISDYNRGHLFPSCHAFEDSDQHSTFTLTNVVPQAITFNSGRWQKMETCIKCVLESYCISKNNVCEGFVVTGAVPSMSKKLKTRVNIPLMLWSAFCCYSHKEKKWLASAHWGNNTPSNDTFMETNTLNNLHQELRIKVFNGTSCPLDETVVDYYRDLPRKCQCQPRPLTTSAPPTTASPTIASSTTSTATTTQTTTNLTPIITGPQTYTTIHHNIQFPYRSSKSGYRGCIRLCRNRHGRFSARYKSLAVPRDQEQFFLESPNPELTLDGFQVSAVTNEDQPDTENEKSSYPPTVFRKNTSLRTCLRLCGQIWRTQKQRLIRLHPEQT